MTTETPRNLASDKGDRRHPPSVEPNRLKHRRKGSVGLFSPRKARNGLLPTPQGLSWIAELYSLGVRYRPGVVLWWSCSDSSPPPQSEPSLGPEQHPSKPARSPTPQHFLLHKISHRKAWGFMALTQGTEIVGRSRLFACRPASMRSPEVNLTMPDRYIFDRATTYWPSGSLYKEIGARMSESPATQEDTTFQHRGGETTRLETFVDAAFAFALTLLVISFDAVPQTYDELVTALRATPAFLAGFLVLTMFWLAHRNWSNRYGLDTTFATLISMALIFLILVYVYPLRAMASAAVAAATNGWLPTSFTIDSVGQLKGLFRIYGTGFILCNLCIAALNLHAYQHRVRLGLSAEEVFLTRTEIGVWCLVGSMGVISICLTFVLPPRWVGLCGWSYASLAIIMPVFGTLVRRRRRSKFGQRG